MDSVVRATRSQGLVLLWSCEEACSILWHCGVTKASYRKVTGPDWHSSERDLLQYGESIRGRLEVNLGGPDRRLFSLLG